MGWFLFISVSVETRNWEDRVETSGIPFSGYAHSAVQFYSRIIVWGGLTATNEGNVQFLDPNILYIFDTSNFIIQFIS